MSSRRDDVIQLDRPRNRRLSPVAVGLGGVQWSMQIGSPSQHLNSTHSTSCTQHHPDIIVRGESKNGDSLGDSGACQCC